MQLNLIFVNKHFEDGKFQIWKMGTKFAFPRTSDHLFMIFFWADVFSFLIFSFSMQIWNLPYSKWLFFFISFREKAVWCITHHYTVLKWNRFCINFFIKCLLILNLIKRNVQIWDNDEKILCPKWVANVPFACIMSYDVYVYHERAEK